MSVKWELMRILLLAGRDSRNTAPDKAVAPRSQPVRSFDISPHRLIAVRRVKDEPVRQSRKKKLPTRSELKVVVVVQGQILVAPSSLPVQC